MLPIKLPSADTFFESPKRIFAHYFESFPISIDNVSANVDYYNRNYLNPAGEANKFLSQGGFVRTRPLARAISTALNWKMLDMEAEVQMAIARGITGFSYDILGLADVSPTGKLTAMLSAAQAVDTRFKILPMPDMNSLTGLTVDQAVTLIAGFTHPSYMRLPDGRLLITAFNANVQPVTWWQAVFAMLNSQGIYVAFVPTLLGEPSSNPLAAISHGFADWGTATPSASKSCPPCSMMGVLPQQFRPKNRIFWEASNSGAFRESWLAAINGGAEWVQYITWSDFSETGQIQPYTDATLATNIGTGFYDMGAYWATWFATGIAPEITKDVLYWFYRKMPSTAVRNANQTASFSVIGPPEESNIEVVAFLTEPGTVIINGVASPLLPDNVPTSFKVPSAPGFPQIKLQRDGSDVFESVTPVQIYGPAGSPAGTLDLTYWSGSISANGLS